MDVLKAGVIGCGRISSVYLDAFQKMDGTVKVCCAADKVLKRAETFAGHFPGCTAYQSAEEMLLKKDVDVIHVLTPHFLHKEHVIKILNAGNHVLTEKPIAIYPEDAREMIRTARENHRQFGVIFQNRYIPGIREARRMVEAGELVHPIGAFSNLNWFRPASYYECDWKGRWETEGGGVVIDQAIHSIDMVRYLIDRPVESICAHIDRRVLTNIEVEDVADAVILFEGGALYSFYACNYYTYNASIRIQVHFKNGKVTLTDNDAVIIERDGEATRVIDSDGNTDGGESYWGKHHLTQLQDFYRCLAAGEPVPVNPEDATRTLEVVQGIYESSRAGKTIFFT